MPFAQPTAAQLAREASTDEKSTQSNWRDAQATHAGVIFNPGGYSHTSVALRDAVEAISIPTVEVHLSNIHAREGFRQKSLTAQAARACLSGLGLQGYLAALESLIAEG